MNEKFNSYVIDQMWRSTNASLVISTWCNCFRIFLTFSAWWQSTTTHMARRWCLIIKTLICWMSSMVLLSPQVNVTNSHTGTSKQNHPITKHLNVHVLLIYLNNEVVYQFVRRWMPQVIFGNIWEYLRKWHTDRKLIWNKNTLKFPFNVIQDLHGLKIRPKYSKCHINSDSIALL